MLVGLLDTIIVKLKKSKMPELNIAPEEPVDPISPMQDINKVWQECKFGRFHLRLLLTTFAGCISSIMVTNSTSYLLPIAECDLKMNLRQKGLLTAMPYVGMFTSSVISGFLIDTFGRVRFLKIGYGGLFFFAVLSAFSQSFEMFAASKLGEGLIYLQVYLKSVPTYSGDLNLSWHRLQIHLSAIAISGVSSITSEFCHPSVRDRVLLCQSSFAAIAQIICPAIAWVILIQNWELNLFEGAFVLKIWNIYLFATSFWALTGYLLFTIMPESPKFLVTRKKYLEARNILIKVYTENTGRSAETFPYPNLWNEEIKEESKPILTKKTGLKEFRRRVLDGLRNMKPLLKRPLLSYLAIISAMQLVTVGMYNVLRLWFPQLSTIVEHYKLDGNQNLCELLDSYTAGEKMRISNSTLNTTEACVPHVSGTETYVNSIIIGIACIASNFINGVLVNKVGKKHLMFLSSFITVGALLGIRWANSKTMMVALFSLGLAFMQTMKALTQVVLVEVFPTTMRTLAMSLVMSFARVGTLFGNIGFPILLGMGCEIPFYTMTGMTIGLIVLSIFTPKKTES